MKTMLSFHLIFINNVLFIEIKPISRKRKRIATFLSFFLSFFIPRIEHSPINTQPLFSILILPLKILRLLKIRVTMKAGYGTTTKGNRNSYTMDMRAELKTFGRSKRDGITTLPWAGILYRGVYVGYGWHLCAKPIAVEEMKNSKRDLRRNSAALLLIRAWNLLYRSPSRRPRRKNSVTAGDPRSEMFRGGWYQFPYVHLRPNEAFARSVIIYFQSSWFDQLPPFLSLFFFYTLFVRAKFSIENNLV